MMQNTILSEKQSAMRNIMNSAWKKGIYVFLLAGLSVCSLIVVGILAYSACRYSYYPLTDYSLSDVLFEDFIPLHLLAVVAAAAFTLCLSRVLDRAVSLKWQERICRIVLAVTACILFEAGTVFVSANPYYPIGDQLNVTAGAYYFLNGEYSMLMPGGYIGLYQQQKGFAFLYEILFSIFEPFCYDVAQEIHVIFVVITVLAGYGFVKIHFEKAIYRIIFCFSMLLCTPLMIFLPYIYGDIPAITFCVILFWTLSAYGKTMKKRYIAIGAAVAALALMCRMNTWIILIAMAIGMLAMAVKRWSYKPVLAGLCVIFAAAGAIKAIDVMYEHRSGYESGIGIPSILWIAMGLQETEGEAGVYNRYQQTVFEENGFDREISAQIGRDYIANRMDEFRENPQMAMDFFTDKMRSQWIEPLFESLAATNSFEENKPIPRWIAELYYGSLHDVVWKISNYYQSVIYFAVLVGVIGRLVHIRKDDGCTTLWIPQIALVGGFLFSLIWENQSRYCLSYYIFMLLYVPDGLIQLGVCLELLWHNTVKKNRNHKKDKQSLKRAS